MRKVALKLILASLAVSVAATANAATSASQTITGTLNPYVSVTNATGTTTAVSINNDGSMTASLNPAFTFASNDKSGASATFNVNVNTSDSGGQTAGVSGVNNATSGNIVLGNISNLPTSNGVKDALSSSPTATNNPNVIGYQVAFNIDNPSNGNVPKFDSTGNNVTGNVLTKNTTSTITMNIASNSLRSNTFSTDDTAGTYQATILCTAAAL